MLLSDVARGHSGPALVACLLLSSCGLSGNAPPDVRAWRAGDHHIHSIYSVEWDKSFDPPAPIVAGDANYSYEVSAGKAREYGLSWMVVTDHGGPNHSDFSREFSYPQLFYSRKLVPEVIQFYGMELDTPGAKHCTVIMPHTDDEADQMLSLEKAFGRKDAWPDDPERNNEDRMLDALAAMQAMTDQPLVIVNHPSRSATELGAYGLVSSRQIRAWHDAAPTVVVGMEGAPGHQASSLMPDGSSNKDGLRGDYDDYPTMGGFDQTTATLGGFWDSMLGEGRRWWITANSDSHIHYSEGGEDFWPGEYSKTYVFAEKTFADILSGLRNGNVFVSTGDLITELYVTVSSTSDESSASIGETLPIKSGSDVEIAIRFYDPDGANASGANPEVSRVDVITGSVEGAELDTNPTTAVVLRATPDLWLKDRKFSVVKYLVTDVTQSFYVRIRGTSGKESEPLPDIPGENPWKDLWFYSNPVFVNVE